MVGPQRDPLAFHLTDGASNFTPAEATWLQEQAEHADTVEVPVITAPDGSRRADIGTFQKVVHSQFSQLPAEVKAKYAAKARELELEEAEEAGSSELRAEALRAAKARQLPEHVKATLAQWQNETGYIFFCYACGIDELGQLSAFAEWVGEDREECSFEQIICQAAGWSIENMRSKYLEFGRSIFDPGHRQKEDAGPEMGTADAGIADTVRKLAVDVSDSSSSDDETPGPVLSIPPEEIETIARIVVKGSAMTLAPINEAGGSAQDATAQVPGPREERSERGEGTFGGAPPSEAEPLPCPSPEQSGSGQDATAEVPGPTEERSGHGEGTFEGAPPSEAEPLPRPSPEQSGSVKAKREAAALPTAKARGKKQAARKRGQQVAQSRGIKKAKGDFPSTVTPAETADTPVQVSTVAAGESSQATGNGRSQRQRTHSAKAMGFASLAEKARFEEKHGTQAKGKDKVMPANAKEPKRARKNETCRHVSGCLLVRLLTVFAGPRTSA
ncbi:hypothetical protein A0H81_13046 [Grifola frondosa]|uniref:Uncharacterized protein n=1 Tax=Grifola frondosa TaxID=5627 RepID=A0A1C7LRB3_GRIFR|nr:hypothetical protein A0H81_13046 [Grifola frondosa]